MTYSSSPLCLILIHPFIYLHTHAPAASTCFILREAIQCRLLLLLLLMVPVCQSSSVFWFDRGDPHVPYPFTSALPEVAVEASIREHPIAACPRHWRIAAHRPPAAPGFLLGLCPFPSIIIVTTCPHSFSLPPNPQSHDQDKNTQNNKDHHHQT